MASFAVAVVASTVNATAGNAAIGQLAGPDVSRYQHPNGAAINWDAVFGAGRQSFAIVKATENADITSPTFRQDWSTLEARGFIRGTYHYARPGGASGDAVAEARHYVGVAGTMSRPGQLPPILDLEETGGLAPVALASWVRSWLTEVERLTGRKPMIYTSPGWWDGNVGSADFGAYPLQVAHYTANAAPRLPRGWSTWTFWQYTSSARVAGIPAATDHNRFNGDLAKLRKLARLAGVSSWSGWQGLGGTASSGPSVVNRWGQTLDVFSNGANGVVWTREWTGRLWTPWKSLGGTLTSDPAAVSWSVGRVDVFGRGVDGRVWRTYSNSSGAVYAGWQAVPGSPVIDGAPAVVSWGVNRIDLVVRAQDSKNILHSSFDGVAWSKWENLGAAATSGPAVASWGPGRLDVFTRAGAGNNLVHRAFSAGSWHPWENLGANLTSDPDAVSATANHIDVVARGFDNAAWQLSWQGNGWSGWTKIGGQLTSAPALGSWGGTRLDLFARGRDNQLWHIWRN